MVLLPLRNTNQLEWILARPEPRQAVSAAARPFTQRAFIEAAFALEGYAYGWGGSSPAGDCSEFLGHVAAACGRRVPRSSSSFITALPAQSLPKNSEEKKIALGRLSGRLALLYFPGHIMVYLGQRDGRFYVIHNLYGIHQQDEKGPYIARVNRVVVSDLSLGQGGPKGSLLERVSHVIFFPGTQNP
jgi:hypothetical protein